MPVEDGRETLRQGYEGVTRLFVECPPISTSPFPLLLQAPKSSALHSNTLPRVLCRFTLLARQGQRYQDCQQIGAAGHDYCHFIAAREIVETSREDRERDRGKTPGNVHAACDATKFRPRPIGRHSSDGHARDEAIADADQPEAQNRDFWR